MIVQFVRDMDLETFREDPKTVAAVERKLLLISEAAIRLGDDAERLCPACRGTISAASAIGSGTATTGWMSKQCGTQSWTICRRSGLRY
jgi:hypothetical protein